MVPIQHSPCTEFLTLYACVLTKRPWVLWAFTVLKYDAL